MLLVDRHNGSDASKIPATPPDMPFIVSGVLSEWYVHHEAVRQQSEAGVAVCSFVLASNWMAAESRARVNGDAKIRLFS